MWNRAINLLKGVIPGVSSRAGTGANRAHVEAQQRLKDAISELSQSSTQSSDKESTISSLKKWQEQPLSDLKIEELEELARAHYHGFDDIVARNPLRAFEAWQAAADKGSISALYDLAGCKLVGVGQDKDPVGAFKDFLKLAEHSNHPLAHYNAGLMRFDGHGTDQDEYAAFKHFESAVQGGVQPALYNMANCFASGRGAEKNEKTAFMLYDTAASKGDAKAKFTAATWLFAGRGVDEVDKERSFRLYTEAAEMGHVNAMYNVGVGYMTGEGPPMGRDLLQSKAWFEKANGKGMVQAGINLAKMYTTGIKDKDGEVLISPDLDRAIEIFGQYPDSEFCRDCIETINLERGKGI